jgi:hypothetical protein
MFERNVLECVGWAIVQQITYCELRNGLDNDTANKSLAVRSELRHLAKFCCTYNTPKSVLNLIGTMATQSNKRDNISIKVMLRRVRLTIVAMEKH